ncbi:glycosyltransferase [Pseudoxanthomonas sp. NC8]|nr:glycosyltransferase [Pseudoxanthomonas sp. NC8]
MLEPLGQSHKLAYLEKLGRERDIHLLSFEKQPDWVDTRARTTVARRIAAAGIFWHPRRYHKRPSAIATAWDIGSGIAVGLSLGYRHGIGIVHARSYVPAVMALVLKQVAGTKFVFDMRGFWADERVDGGLWPRDGRMYRLAKWFERRFLLNADHVVSLTHAAVAEMKRFDYLQGRMPPVTVIPTCADLQRFAPQPTPKGDFVLGYVGSAGTWYLFDAVVAAFVRLLERLPAARLLVVNRNEHDYIRQRLQAGGVPQHAVELCAASHAQVPELMARMHAGVFFIKPVFSKQASAATRLGEFLGCGIPCLTNTGVGDMTAVLEGERVGVAVDGFDPATLDAGLTRLLALVQEPDLRQRCVAAAHKHFSLDEGVARYRAMHAELDGT